ncbi:hypothetical protein RclHR1_00140018 [Rhizophagus clarus]|uniref:BTB/POZ protein n=1 Tax=Rhizophagus clarus TaxID=94130 RepID=A0A2Z6QR73_9GLOM|nr:hypothetical protein RclHR1_00140018 [Rhizophagus clarus]GET01064.1 BTB/POZ protein [Rhizophagus clarus]
MNITHNDNLLLPQMKLNHMATDLQKGLLYDLYWLLKESNNHDAVINIGEAPNVKSFKAHTSILCARSLYFRALLSSGHTNKRNSLIEITQTNIQPDVFDAILRFLYTGKISIKNEKDVKNLFKYIIAAEKLWLYQLIQYIENYLIYQLNDWLKSNFVYVLIITNKNPSSFRLLHEFVNDMLKNHPYLLFETDDFNAIPENILVQLLQHRKFSKDLTEEKIWNSVLNWGINQNIDLYDKDVRDWTPLDFSGLQTSLQRVVPLIRFANIPPKIFYDIVEPYKEILTTGLYQKITQNPSFVTYNKLMLRPLPTYTILSSKLSKTSHKRESLTSIPSPLLHAFPMPPSKDSLKNESSLPTTNNQSPPKSIINSIPITAEDLTLKSTCPFSDIPKSKSKHMAKRNGSIIKKDELLAKITSSVLSSTYTIRRKPKETSTTTYRNESLEKCPLSKEKIKESKFGPAFEIKTLKSLGPEVDTSSLTLRKMKRLLNRKASIVSHTTSSSTMSVSTLPI